MEILDLRSEGEADRVPFDESMPAPANVATSNATWTHAAGPTITVNVRHDARPEDARAWLLRPQEPRFQPTVPVGRPPHQGEVVAVSTGERYRLQRDDGRLAVHSADGTKLGEGVDDKLRDIRAAWVGDGRFVGWARDKLIGWRVRGDDVETVVQPLGSLNPTAVALAPDGTVVAMATMQSRIILVDPFAK